MRTQGRGAVQKALTKAQLEKLSGRRPAEFWASFWSRAESVGDCFVWCGPRDERGRGVLAVGPRRFAAAKLAWVYDGRKLKPGMVLSASCQDGLCIKPAHQVVRGVR